MVQAWKKEKVNEIVELMDKSPVVGLLDMHKLPAAQLQKIKKSLVGKAEIQMVRKRLIKRALEKSSRKDIGKLYELDFYSPALLLSNENPFRLSAILKKNKAPSYAKEGDIAPFDIIVPAGPTSLPPGPAISDLQKAGIKAKVGGDKIEIIQDSVVARKGDEINAKVANVLMTLDIKPMEIGLTLVGAYEGDIVYKSDILDVDDEEYKSKIMLSFTQAFNLSFNIEYPTKDTIELMISNAHSNAFNLALNADVMTKETVGITLQKAQVQANALKSMVPETAVEKKADVPEEKPKQEEAKEEPKEEQKSEEKPAEKEAGKEEKPEKKPEAEEKKKEPIKEEKAEDNNQS